MSSKTIRSCLVLGLFVLISAPGALAFGGGKSGGGNNNGGNGGNGGNGQPGEVLGHLNNTYYYLTDESEYAGQAKTATLRTMGGAIIAYVSPNFKAATDIEGSGRLEDGRVVNYAGGSGSSIRYRVTANPWGDGAYRNCPLVPFHTIAINRNQIPLGSVVRISETVGMLLPDGTRHNGLWRADDVGGAIGWDRVDLFIGLRRYERTNHILTNQGITHMRALTVTLVHAAGTTDCNEPVQ